MTGTRIALVAGAAGAAGAAILLSLVSVSGSTDTPCGPLLDRNAAWSTDNACGITYTGTAVVVAVLVALAVTLAVLGLRTASRPTAAAAVLSSVAIVGFVAFLLVAWRASAHPEPVLGRGWRSVRDTAGWTTLGITLAAGIAVLAVALGGTEEDGSTDQRSAGSDRDAPPAGKRRVRRRPQALRRSGRDVRNAGAWLRGRR